MLFQTVSMTFCDSSFFLLGPLWQNGLPPPFPGETVPLFLYLLTCVVAGLQRTPTLLFLLSAPLSTNFIEFKIAEMGTSFHRFLSLFLIGGSCLSLHLSRFNYNLSNYFMWISNLACRPSACVGEL